MQVPDHLVYGFGSSMLACLLWIGKSIAGMAKEVKIVGMIIRACPNCKPTAEMIDEANEGSL